MLGHHEIFVEVRAEWGADHPTCIRLHTAYNVVNFSAQRAIEAGHALIEAGRRALAPKQQALLEE
jgi:hypothetical protein